jgi:O-antigen ligase
LGEIFYFGDAFVASFYLVGFGLAVALPSVDSGSNALVKSVLGALLSAALISVGLALVQWLRLDGLGIFLADFSEGGRPYANLAQPNQLATLLMLGVVATLALFQQRVLGRFSYCIVTGWLMLGIAMTQSRTTWLAMALLVAWLLWVSKGVQLRVGRLAVAVMGCGYAVFVVAWPMVSKALFLAPGRTLADQASGGVRLELWSILLDAVGRAPWSGYGWNQTSVAQIRVAADHAATGSWVEDSHNLLIELLVMNGIPIGGLIAMGICVWFWRRAVHCTDPQVSLAIGAVLVVGVHAMLEFPLDYAYFLLPVGIVVGYIEANVPAGKSVVMSAKFPLILGLVMSLLLARVAMEYADIESRNRALRFEMAGFGAPTDLGPVVPVHLLTQLEELPKFARTLARRDMSRPELEGMRKMAERYAYPPVLFRYALAAGLNGDPETASRMLRVLCHVHSAERCEEGRAAWDLMGNGAYPELKNISMPPAEIDTRSAP